MVNRVTVFALCCLLGESSLITFLAYIVDHVGCVGVFLAAWSVHFVTISKRGAFFGRGSSINTKRSMFSVVETFGSGGKIRSRWM
jgi:hypothetical protein